MRKLMLFVLTVGVTMGAWADMLVNKPDYVVYVPELVGSQGASGRRGEAVPASAQSVSALRLEGRRGRERTLFRSRLFL